MSDNEMPSTSSGYKNPQGKIVKSGQRLMAYNIYLKHKNEGFSKTSAVQVTAEEVGLSERLIFEIVKEMETTGQCKSPNKKRERQDIYDKLSEDEKKAIRYTVHNFFKKNEIPTINKVLEAVKDNEFIPEIGRTSLFKVLKKLGFVWEKRGKNSMLTERAQRKNYLRNHPVPYKIDDIVKKTGRKVLRLPPYHCKLNPIELIWAQVKGFVARNNKSFKLPDVKNLFFEGLAQVTAQNWTDCVQHILKEEEELYTLDNIIENMTFNVNTGSSSEDDFSSEN